MPFRRSALVLGALAACAHGELLIVDVAVYGSTVCAISACVAASRMNASCAFVEPQLHVGGMTTGGLSSVDKRMAVGGIAREIFGDAQFPHFTPSSLNATLYALLASAGPGAITSRTNVGEIVGVFYSNTTPRFLASVTFDSILTIQAHYWIDCSYEGNLLVSSGSRYTVGREAATDYNESMAGVAGNKPWSAGAFEGVSPWVNASNTTLLPTVSALPAGLSPGDADRLVMSMNYRLCLTNNASNARPFVPPKGYTPESMEFLRRWWHMQAVAGRTPTTLQSLFLWEPLPCGKADVNQGPMPMGSDQPFLQRGYITNNWLGRRFIAAQHEWWTRAVWEFLRTDPIVPLPIRTEAATWGLPLDEFIDTLGFPPQLYVREGPRLRGAIVMTQHDVYGSAVAHSPSSVGLSQWCVDVHAEQRVAVPPSLTGRGWEVADAGDVNTCTGDTWQLTEIPFGALIAAANDTEYGANLLVPVCASFTHVAFATYRLEAQYAIFGQSAAVAAVLALRSGYRALQALDIAALQAELRAQGQLLDAVPPPAPGGALRLAPCVNAPQWAFHPDDGSLRRVSGGACVSIWGYSNSTGGKLVSAACHTDRAPYNQAFNVVADGGVALRSRIPSVSGCARDGEPRDGEPRDGAAMVPAARKEAKRLAKVAARALKRGEPAAAADGSAPSAVAAGHAPAGSELFKSCDLCAARRPLLYRCTIDATCAWIFVCTSCWPSVSGGVTDGNRETHPHYRYGGTWKYFKR